MINITFADFESRDYFDQMFGDQHRRPIKFQMPIRMSCVDWMRKNMIVEHVHGAFQVKRDLASGKWEAKSQQCEICKTCKTSKQCLCQPQLQLCEDCFRFHLLRPEVQSEIRTNATK